MNILEFNYKYFKYKQKYLELKGGTDIEPIKNLYLPCEIQNYTIKIFLIENVFQYLYKYLTDNTFNPFIDSIFNIEYDRTSLTDYTFCQDPLILLKKKDNTNYGIRIIPPIESFDDITVYNYIIPENEYRNGNNYGGNFISTPHSETINGCIIYFNGIAPALYTYLDENIFQTLIGLECSFKYNGARHIDECLCIIPYGATYKIWMYYIRNIKKKECYNFEHYDQRSLENILNEFKTKVEINTEFINNIIQNKKNGTPQNIDDIKSFKRIMHLITKDKDREYILMELFNLQIDVHEYIQKFNLERQMNEEAIRSKLGNIEIINIPIDLLLDEIMYYNDKYSLSYMINWKIDMIPIFNRVWIENSETCKLLFSIKEIIQSEETILDDTGDIIYPTIINDDNEKLIIHDPNNIIDEETRCILNSQITEIKSMVNPTKKVDIQFINTSKYNNEGSVGGNLHCLIKNKY